MSNGEVIKGKYLSQFKIFQMVYSDTGVLINKIDEQLNDFIKGKDKYESYPIYIENFDLKSHSEAGNVFYLGVLHYQEFFPE